MLDDPPPPSPIPADALGEVTGGTGSSDSSSTLDPQVSAALQGIMSSLKDLSSNNNNSNNSFAQLLPFIMLLRGSGGFSSGGFFSGGGCGYCPPPCGKKGW